MSDLKCKVKKVDHSLVAAQVVGKMDMLGLDYRQRQFVMSYVGDLKGAAEDAGYGNTDSDKKNKASLYRAVRALLANDRIRTCIEVINQGLEYAGVISSLEMRMILTEMIKDPLRDDKVRLQAIKIMSACYADFSEKIVIDSHTTSHEVREYIFQGPKSNFLDSLSVTSDSKPEISHTKVSSDLGTSHLDPAESSTLSDLEEIL